MFLILKAVAKKKPLAINADVGLVTIQLISVLLVCGGQSTSYLSARGDYSKWFVYKISAPGRWCDTLLAAYFVDDS